MLTQNLHKVGSHYLLLRKTMYYSFKQAINLFIIQNTDVRGIVLQCFPSEEQGSPLITKRDVVIVNEE